jgi:hypothetical protein
MIDSNEHNDLALVEDLERGMASLDREISMSPRDAMRAISEAVNVAAEGASADDIARWVEALCVLGPIVDARR